MDAWTLNDGKVNTRTIVKLKKGCNQTLCSHLKRVSMTDNATDYQDKTQAALPTSYYVWKDIK